jgi:hypothetical protein
VPSPSDRGEPSDADATVQVGLAVVGIFGELPAPVAGLDLSTRVRLRWASIGVEGEATLPASRAVGSASREVSASLLSTAVVPCVHRAPFVACIVARFGALRAEGSGVDVPARESSFYASLAMRIGAEFRSSRTTSFLANVDGVAPLTRVALDLGATEAWVVPSFGVRASVGARMQF